MTTKGNLDGTHIRQFERQMGRFTVNRTGHGGGGGSDGGGDRTGHGGGGGGDGGGRGAHNNGPDPTELYLAQARYHHRELADSINQMERAVQPPGVPSRYQLNIEMERIRYLAQNITAAMENVRRVAERDQAEEEQEAEESWHLRMSSSSEESSSETQDQAEEEQEQQPQDRQEAEESWHLRMSSSSEESSSETQDQAEEEQEQQPQDRQEAEESWHLRMSSSSEESSSETQDQAEEEQEQQPQDRQEAEESWHLRMSSSSEESSSETQDQAVAVLSLRRFAKLSLSVCDLSFERRQICLPEIPKGRVMSDKGTRLTREAAKRDAMLEANGGKKEGDAAIMNELKALHQKFDGMQASLEKQLNSKVDSLQSSLEKLLFNTRDELKAELERKVKEIGDNIDLEMGHMRARIEAIETKMAGSNDRPGEFDPDESVIVSGLRFEEGEVIRERIEELLHDGM
ncbi:Hypp4874 [Branchiostoma lanceolatum]|uniref:Hypp4874 protein n=1 Tax=Branchiostoma lanceolatum TaxID=7740 RepID=A0A8K0ABY4_BRALA|nr:Hypp4874 [Branchiostoma lanceolatum]